MFAVLLPSFWLNRLGLPVKTFAWPLAVVLLAAAALYLFTRRRGPVPLRAFFPFAVVVLIALLLVGRPMLEFGFNWVSYANDDMATYVIIAQRFLHHGFFEYPTPEQIALNLDMGVAYSWFMQVQAGERGGGELLVAILSALSGLGTPAVYMPLTLAMYAALLLAASALVLQSVNRRAALLACILVSASALNTLGVLYQLTPQLAGLSSLAGCAAVMCRPVRFRSRAALVRRGLLGAYFFSGLLIVYPEVLPFLGLSFLVYFAVAVLRRRQPIGPLFAWAGVAGAGTLVLVNQYILGVIVFLHFQLRGLHSESDLDTSLFPFYLVPSGIAYFWGFLPIPRLSSDLVLTTLILAGTGLSLAALVAVVWQALRGAAVASVAVVMCSLYFVLLSNQADFGLFKLAMFAQPFVLGTMAAAWTEYAWRRR